MTKRNVFSIVLSFLFFQALLAQEKKDSLVMQFHLRFDATQLVANQEYVSKNNDTLQIETFRFYISNIEIQYEDKTIFKPKNCYHLIDLASLESQRIPLNLFLRKPIQKIIFTIGIDSLASVSGALGGDLDPAKGMYWAWQSGYINMKMEGKSPSCKTRKNEFQFHIGGYLKPNNAMRIIDIPILKTHIATEIIVGVDVAKLFDTIDLKTINSIMIPGKQAMKIADYSTQFFQIE